MRVSRKLIWLILFGIGFGFVEASVVAYLRNCYYPEGFAFPLKMIPKNILLIEVVREVATLVILIAVGALTGTTGLARFSAFVIVFGVWDIFYYVWLRVFLSWPHALLDWDVLFLIPVPWVGPVLAPVLVSLAMIGCGSWAFLREESFRPVKVTLLDWGIEIAAGVIIILSFLGQDATTMPESFPWWLFLLGLVGGVVYFVWKAARGESRQR